MVDSKEKTMITNFMLKHFIIEPDEKLFQNDIESEEIKTIDKQNEELACDAFCKELSGDLGRFHDALESENEKKCLLYMAHSIFFLQQQHQHRKNLEKQLNQCIEFLKTDMCHRNQSIKLLIENEKLKLEQALYTDIVKLTANALNSMFLNTGNSPKKFDRYVKVSEGLHYLGIYKDDPFMTLAEANDYAERNGEKNGKKVIYDRLKHIITE